MLGPLGCNCFRRDKLDRDRERRREGERERGGGGKEGERDKILKINKVCV